jgi:hypothetical protein
LNSPADGGTFVLGSVVTASYSCSDDIDGPGIASCVGPVADGSAIDTTTPGVHRFAVTARSQDKQRTSVTHKYTVVDPTM